MPFSFEPPKRKEEKKGSGGVVAVVVVVVGGSREDLYGPLSRNWPSIYGTCHSQDAEVPSQLFMARHPITAHHSLNGTQPFGAARRPAAAIFLSNRGRVGG